MRGLIALLALMLLSAAAPARDWTRVVALSPQGGHVVGNPGARVKIVEYASYTCSHCGQFAAESKVALAQRIRSGSTSIEYRHLLLNGLDLAAVILARCEGPKRFAALHEAFFESQSAWLRRGSDFARDNAAALASATPPVQMRTWADGAGLTAIARAKGGLTGPGIDRCFADRAALDRIVAAWSPARAAAAGVSSTPSFFVNGRKTEVHDWSGLEPLLDAR
jgi:hypothetical protein